jgi:hypothetical protein
MTTFAEALEEIHKAIPKVVLWMPDLSDIAAKAPVINFRAFTGTADGWQFLVVGVDVPGYDPIRQFHGSATKAGIIMKLPPDLARQAGETAEAIRV